MDDASFPIHRKWNSSPCNDHTAASCLVPFHTSSSLSSKLCGWRSNLMQFVVGSEHFVETTWTQPLTIAGCVETILTQFSKKLDRERPKGHQISNHLGTMCWYLIPIGLPMVSLFEQFAALHSLEASCHLFCWVSNYVFHKDIECGCSPQSSKPIKPELPLWQCQPKDIGIIFNRKTCNKKKRTISHIIATATINCMTNFKSEIC